MRAPRPRRRCPADRWPWRSGRRLAVGPGREDDPAPGALAVQHGRRAARRSRPPIGGDPSRPGGRHGPERAAAPRTARTAAAGAPTAESAVRRREAAATRLRLKAGPPPGLRLDLLGNLPAGAQHVLLRSAHEDVALGAAPPVADAP